jgi:hypothetical protein
MGSPQPDDRRIALGSDVRSVNSQMFARRVLKTLIGSQKFTLPALLLGVHSGKALVWVQWDRGVIDYRLLAYRGRPQWASLISAAQSSVRSSDSSSGANVPVSAMCWSIACGVNTRPLARTTP